MCAGGAFTSTDSRSRAVRLRSTGRAADSFDLNELALCHETNTNLAAGHAGDVIHGHDSRRPSPSPFGELAQIIPRSTSVARARLALVNLASLLLADGFRGNYEVAVVLSNDSDLVLPMEIATRELGLRVGLLNPHKRFSVELSRAATFKKRSVKACCAIAGSPMLWLTMPGERFISPRMVRVRCGGWACLKRPSSRGRPQPVA